MDMKMIANETILKVIDDDVLNNEEIDEADNILHMLKSFAYGFADDDADPFDFLLKLAAMALFVAADCTDEEQKINKCLDTARNLLKENKLGGKGI